MGCCRILPGVCHRSGAHGSHDVSSENAAYVTCSGILGCTSCTSRHIKIAGTCVWGTFGFAAVPLQLIKLADLENDFINPHDASNSLNSVVVRGRNRSYVYMYVYVVSHTTLCDWPAPRISKPLMLLAMPAASSTTGSIVQLACLNIWQA